MLRVKTCAEALLSAGPLGRPLRWELNQLAGEATTLTEAEVRAHVSAAFLGVLSLVLVAAIFYFLRRRIDPAQTWAAITAMTGPELVTLGLLAVWNLCTYAFVWMAVTPGLGFWRAMVMTQATTAVANTVPGGSAMAK